MKPRLLAAFLLAALWLFVLLAFLRHASPAISSNTRDTGILPRAVVINEVAWMGTDANAASINYEWIELYNTTGQEIDLRNCLLNDYNGTLAILTGTIPAGGYYLLARLAATFTGAEPKVDQLFSGNLRNDGEAITLTDHGGVVIDTANIERGYDKGWAAGINGSHKYTMERINPLTPDTDSNWASNDGVIRNGHDADGNPINGTPKQPNSVTSADLGIAQSSPIAVMMNREITYILTFSDAGRLDAFGVIITDTLPLNASFIRQLSFYPFTQTQDGRAVAWQVGVLSASSGNLSLTFTVQPEMDYVGLLTNTAVITSDVPDYHPANNVATTALQVTPPSADVSIAKSAPASLTAGAEITYVITLSNVGQAIASGVSVTDTLPLSVTFARQSAPYPLTPGDSALVWDVGDVLTSGGPISWTVTGRVNINFAGTMTNLVQISTITDEPVQANNASQATTLVTPPAPAVLIGGVLYDGYQYDDEDEAIQIVNVGSAPVNLQGWRVAGAVFPSYTLGIHQRAWATRNALAFRDSFGFWPDLAVTGTLTNGVLAMRGPWSQLSNSGGDAQLKNDAGQVVDRLVYGDETPPAYGWRGPTVYPYGIGGADGQIIARVPDERTGLPAPDTDTAADWIQYTDNYTTGRRVLYPGWDMDLFFWPFTTTVPATITLGVAPDNAYDVVREAIRSASSRIEIEAYELTHYGVITEVLQKAQAGVSVTVLLEGEPVSGINSQERWACRKIRDAGGQCWFMHDYHPTNYYIFDRYDLIHSKLIILDRQQVVISTQNLSGGGMPDDDKSDGTFGSRGYVLDIVSSELAARAGLIFDRDRDPAHADIAPWGTFGFVDPPGNYAPITTSGGATSTIFFTAPLVVTDATRFELFTSPEASLRQSDALLGLLARAGAGDEVYVEQMYEYPNWGDDVTAPNMRLKAYVDAARRRARVRILLNSGTFGQSRVDLTDNMTTTAYVNALARQEGLDLQARMGDPTQYGIHSKMVLVRLNPHPLPPPPQSGGGAGWGRPACYSHVGSINGSEASSKINREIAVQVESQNLCDGLSRVFWADWNLAAPAFLPVVLQDYTPPPPPADHVLISEVYYSNTVSLQWVELYNPTERAIDLADYKIGDAETPERYEGMYLFPTGAVIGPGSVLVIAFDGTQAPQANFQMCPTCGGSAPVLLKYAAWGQNGDWTLRGAGDQILLLGPNDVPVDVVVYGDAIYPGVAAHPGVSVYTHSLERYPANRDTNNCATDFRDQYPPTPGRLPPYTTTRLYD